MTIQYLKTTKRQINKEHFMFVFDWPSGPFKDQLNNVLPESESYSYFEMHAN